MYVQVQLSKCFVKPLNGLYLPKCVYLHFYGYFNIEQCATLR